jgi:hypothetical protein
MSNIIIPSSVDENAVRIPMEFPLRSDVDTIMDANGKTVATIDSSIANGETIKFAKLFAKAPEMFQLLGDCYAVIAAVAVNSGGMGHGQPDEKKEDCILCRCESILQSLQ